MNFNIRQSYREGAVQGASPVGLVVQLYEQMIEDLREVSRAIEQKDIQRRSNKIKHAILVIGHLQSSLDFVHGGKVARDLDTFYNLLRQNLVRVQFHPSLAGITQQITDLLAVRAAWIEVERAEKSRIMPAPVPAAVSRVALGATQSEPERVRSSWRG